MKIVKYLLPVALFLGIFLICCEEDDPVDPRDKFEGTFLMTEVYGSGGDVINYQYTIEISKSRIAGSQILISNIGEIIIYGKSIGANIATQLLSERTAAAFIFDSGFTSAYEMGKRIFPYLPLKLCMTINYDAVCKVDKILIPKLIIHSKDDEVVPFSMGQEIFKVAACPKEFFALKGGHNEAIFLIKHDYMNKINEFINKYVVGD